MLENTPHDWLFPRVSAVIHHGGAGTTAIGLKCGKPTMIVPFFGDQPFWGSMVAKAGAGAEAVPYKNLSVDALAEGIKQCLSPEAKVGAERIAKSIAKEGDGAKNAVESFHRLLPLRGESSMCCSVFPDRVAVWVLKDTTLRLSALAAQLFVDKKKFRWQDLRLIRHYEWSDFEGPGEPLTGAGAALASTAGGLVKGVGGVPLRWAKSIKRHEKLEKGRGKRRRKGEKSPGSPESRVSGTNRHDAHEPSQGRQHGVEPNVPKRDSVDKVAFNLHANTNLSKPFVVGPVPSNMLDSDEEDIVSTAGLGDHLAQELVEDVGISVAKSGEALAKGLSSHRGNKFLTSSKS